MSEPEQRAVQPHNSTSADLIEEITEVAPLEIAAARHNDPLFAAEKEALESERLKIQVDRLQDELEEARDLHGLRKTYTGRLFWLIVVWLGIVVVFVALTGAWKARFSLSDAVLIAFITSTTLSVLGLFVLVAKWLYPAHLKDELDRSQDGRK